MTYDQANELTSSGTIAPPLGTSTPSAAFQYDLVGERTTVAPVGGAPTTYSYDQAGHLTSVAPATGTTTSFTYNGDGLRATKTTGSATSHFTWDQTSDLPLALTDGQNSYIYGPDHLAIEQINQAGTPSYLHHDQLGSTRLITNQDGNATATFAYTPYGTPNATTGTVTTSLGYAGQYTDPETGLQYLRARYYDATTGQFISRDPLEAITHQPYSYANDNPTNFTDPSGQLFGIPDPFTPLAGAIGGIVGGVSGAIGYGAGVISGGQSFSVSGLAGATVGGVAGGALTGACVEETDLIAVAGCGAAGGGASTVVNNVINGQSPTSGLVTGVATGAAGNVIAGGLFPTRGMLPQNMSNLLNPGSNAQRLYAQAGFAGLAGAFATAAQGTPAYADAFGLGGLCGFG